MHSARALRNLKHYFIILDLVHTIKHVKPATVLYTCMYIHVYYIVIKLLYIICKLLLLSCAYFYKCNQVTATVMCLFL